jgi:hypothetical protein
MMLTVQQKSGLVYAGNTKPVDFVEDIAQPAVDQLQFLCMESTVQRLVLLSIMDKVERSQRPVLQKKRLILFCQTSELLQRLALVALIHLDVVSLSPLFSTSRAFPPFLASRPVINP